MPRSKELTTHLSDKERGAMVAAVRFMEGIEKEYGVLGIEIALRSLQHRLDEVRNTDLESR